MEVRIGIVNAPREVSIDLGDDGDGEEVKQAIAAAISSGQPIVWLADRKGREVGFPPDRVAYVEMSARGDNRIGFS